MNFSKIFMIFAILASIGISIIVYCFFPSYTVTGFEKALDGVLLFSSITLGFYGACLSVLASIFNTKIVKEIMHDQKYRREFVVISGCNLVTGFLTVITTIVYQVMLANKGLPETPLRLTNSLWSGFVFLYIFLTVLFVTITFMIFLSNSDDQSTAVHDGRVGNPDFFK
ncbi:hypothetical protein [Paenibacillus lautus]|uniref:hypothetical protein n=1 Tax=Paenibacillus lautus TaxID=1401 RepID=UPI001C7E181B|nr:hypothetical protein [Paenibacillus lautus]MBX4145954.1 hypothetical protein [Paenibacillus lautus]